MKILWLTNYPLPCIARRIGLPVIVNEGWLITLSNLLLSDGHEIIFCTAMNNIKKDIVIKNRKWTFCGIYNKTNKKYNNKLKVKFASILDKEAPEIVHIMGTEFPHSYAMIEACSSKDYIKRCIVSIQGIISKIAKVYDLMVPEKTKKRRLLWDLFVQDSIILNKRDFAIRGKYEVKTLKIARNVIGRTEWDYLCVKEINPLINYYKGNEILRSIFYQKRWEYEKCRKHSIIISQATYPVKGFHILLQAAAILKTEFPDLKIYVPSYTMYSNAMTKPSFLNSDYVNYIIRLVKENHLENNIEFMGSLDEENMCNAYLQSNVFVCTSTIENSSNSLGEAMILGMPIVSSYVGGLSSMMRHGEEGFFFPLHEYYTLAFQIKKVFIDSKKAINMGEKARNRALDTHSIEKNYHELLKSYADIKMQEGTYSE